MSTDDEDEEIVEEFESQSFGTKVASTLSSFTEASLCACAVTFLFAALGFDRPWFFGVLWAAALVRTLADQVSLIALGALDLRIGRRRTSVLDVHERFVVRRGWWVWLNVFGLTMLYCLPGWIAANLAIHFAGWR